MTKCSVIIASEFCDKLLILHNVIQRMLFLTNMSVRAFVISRIKPQSFTAIYISVAILIAGCGSLQSGAELPDAVKLMQEGAHALDQGQKEKGLALFATAARANPASADPWAKTAQAQFDAENYSAAIVAADEAQKRDPSRKETKAISVVASLRVAVRALTDMREDSNLRGTTRSEAERLARMLRETLGQDVLVPVPEEPRVLRRTQPPTAPPATTPPPPVAIAAPAPAGAPARNGPRKPERMSSKPAAGQSSSAPTGGDANPFNVLK
jgi:hypothetical protein